MFVEPTSQAALFSLLFPFCLCPFYHYALFVSVLLVSFLSLHCFCFACVVSVTTLIPFLFLFCLCRFYHDTVFVAEMRPLLLHLFFCFHFIMTPLYKPCPSSCRHSLCVISPYNLEYSPVDTRPDITFMSNWELKNNYLSLSISLSIYLVCLSILLIPNTPSCSTHRQPTRPTH